MLATDTTAIWSKGRPYFFRRSLGAAAAATLSWYLAEPVSFIGFSSLGSLLLIAAIRHPRLELAEGTFAVVNARSFRVARFDVEEVVGVERVESLTSSSLNSMTPPRMHVPHMVRFHLEDGRRVDYHDGASRMNEDEVVRAIELELRDEPRGPE